MTTSTTANLLPIQKVTFDNLLSIFDISSIINCWCPNGRGRTTVLNSLHETVGGKRLSIRDFVEETSQRHPLALEDSLYSMLLDAFKENNCVIVDDFHIATTAMDGCNSYPRSGLLDSAALALANYVIESGKKLILGSDGSLPFPFRARSYSYEIGKFTAADYRHLCKSLVGEHASKIDFDKIHRFAPKLNAHQLKLACSWLGKNGEAINTDKFIDYLKSQQLTSNVSLDEVAKVELSELKGVDDVVRSLETNIVIPLENDLLATELNLRPKRGVLLVGPPGTGKTTVGKALAHRLKGKFLLIDGTFISGTGDFYHMINRIFRVAKENAPSVIFIDDSDVIFESGQEHGLYRYLLTMLDGLESESAGKVCVVMTAMDVGNLPPALVRSGRIELWLEMKLPDESARYEILQKRFQDAPAPFNQTDTSTIVAQTDGFTGADLKRMVEDGKALFAYDRVTQNDLKEITDYFIDAAKNVRSTKEKYLEAANKANAAHPSRPAWFNPYLYADANCG